MSELITHSELATFAQCEQKHDWSYRRRLRKEGDRKIFLDFGTAMHAALAAYFSAGENLTAGLTALEAACNVWVEDIRKGKPVDTEQLAEVETWRVVGRCLLRGHDAEWNSDGELKILGAELEFRYPVMDDGAPDYGGKIDLVVEHPDGRIGVWDHKIQGSLDLPFDLGLYRQVTGYQRACQDLFGKPADYVQYNILRKPGIKQKKTETLEEYEGRLLQDVTGERPGFYFARPGTKPPPGRMDEWERELPRWVERMELAAARGPLKSTDSCFGRYGYACQFLLLCQENADEDPEAFERLSEGYVIKDRKHTELEEIE